MNSLKLFALSILVLAALPLAACGRPSGTNASATLDSPTSPAPTADVYQPLYGKALVRDAAADEFGADCGIVRSTKQSLRFSADGRKVTIGWDSCPIYDVTLEVLGAYRDGESLFAFVPGLNCKRPATSPTEYCRIVLTGNLVYLLQTWVPLKVAPGSMPQNAVRNLRFDPKIKPSL